MISKNTIRVAARVTLDIVRPAAPPRRHARRTGMLAVFCAVFRSAEIVVDDDLASHNVSLRACGAGSGQLVRHLHDGDERIFKLASVTRLPSQCCILGEEAPNALGVPAERRVGIEGPSDANALGRVDSVVDRAALCCEGVQARDLLEDGRCLRWNDCYGGSCDCHLGQRGAGGSTGCPLWRWPTHNASYLVLLVAHVAILCAVPRVANCASIDGN